MSFGLARRRAVRAQISNRLTGKDDSLLSFEQIRDELDLQNPVFKGIQDISLDNIVGSVGRYRDFTRHFLPLKDSLRERWIGVEQLAMDMGWPPIDVFKIGSAYFVKDGNHRTAVARQMDNKTIEAKVWEYPADVEIALDEKLDDVLVRLGRVHFNTKTQLAQELSVTIPGQYGELLGFIEDARRELADTEGHSIDFIDASSHWFEEIYEPTVALIRERDLMRHFPKRTETDLFCWMSRNRAELGDDYPQIVETIGKRLSVRANLLRRNFSNEITPDSPAEPASNYPQE